MALRDFVKNYEDMSDDNGYQFKFKCDVCGDGYLTKYRQAPFARAKSLLGAGEKLAGMGSSVFGRFGGLGGGHASGAAGDLHSAKWREAKEKAFDEAVVEARGHFTKCPSCRNYADATCWNDQSQMCVTCAPRQAVVVQQARAQAFVSAAQETMRAKDYSAEITTAEEVKVICSNCGKPTGSGKFCESCGAPLDKAACPNCGAKNSATARFCNTCGTKLGGSVAS